MKEGFSSKQSWKRKNHNKRLPIYQIQTVFAVQHQIEVLQKIPILFTKTIHKRHIQTDIIIISHVECTIERGNPLSSCMPYVQQKEMTHTCFQYKEKQEAKELVKAQFVRRHQKDVSKKLQQKGEVCSCTRIYKITEVPKKKDQQFPQRPKPTI